MTYQVVWARCNVFHSDGTVETLARGDFVPGAIDDVQKAQLATIGAARFVDVSLPPAEAVPASAPAPTESKPDDADDEPVGYVEGGLIGSVAAEQASPDSDEPDDEKPKRTDSKPEWEAYAVSQGMSEDDAAKATKADLVARFG